MKSGENFRVTTQLIDVETGNHLWSDTYDGIFSDTIFVVQSHIAKKIAASLDAVIRPDKSERIDRTPPTDVESYDLYLKGHSEYMKYWIARERKHLGAAHQLLDRALQIDPEFLQAIALKGQIFSAEQKSDSALFYAEKVIAMDPGTHHGYGLKGISHFHMGNGDEAIENLLIAISLPPKDDQWRYYPVVLGRVYFFNKNDVLKALTYMETMRKLKSM
jgi:tetratricopeptide (TPR) repeat protein